MWKIGKIVRTNPATFDPVDPYERSIWWEGWGCGVFTMIVVGIVAGALWMLITESTWTY